MELYQLKLFVDLAETGNFTKVASENYVTQAAVTLQIRKLESELGIPLFHRTTRSVTLVEAGQSCFPTPVLCCNKPKKPKWQCATREKKSPASCASRQCIPSDFTSFRLTSKSS